MNIKVKETSSLVLCLCKLHNYCIAKRDMKMEKPGAKDRVFINSQVGGIINWNMAAGYNYNYDPDREGDREELDLDGGEHYVDVAFEIRRAPAQARAERVPLPYKVVHSHIEEQGYKRPTPVSY